MEKKWQDMTPEEKRNARIEEWLNADGVNFESPEAKAMYQASINRLMDAVLLRKVPDRVPVCSMYTFMPSNIYGLTAKESIYDSQKLVDANVRFMKEFKPDFTGSPALVGSGKVFEALDMGFYKWSGRQLDDNLGYQFDEKEYMTAEEYDDLIEDPSNFWLRTYMPRIFNALKPLSSLPSLTHIWEVVLVSGSMIPFGLPDVQKALQALMTAGSEALAWIQKIGEYDQRVFSAGYPSLFGGATKVPFDMLGDTLRGTKGIMMDMFRRPDKVLEAIEKITPIYVKQGVGMATMSKNPIVFIPMHKGADGFMSDAQFKKFYWPGLKALVNGLVKEGCIPFLFCEGGYNSRLEYLKDLDKASCFWVFDRTDMVRAKEICKDRICIGGNVPAGLLLTGTVQQVKDCCKELIDTVGPGGGYVMCNGTSMDEGKADTLHAMIDFTKEYGVYK